MVDSRAKGARGEYLVRDMLREHAGYQFEEPGCFTILEKFVPFSQHRFEYLGGVFPPRQSPFRGLPGVEFLHSIGQAQPISTFIPGQAKATEDMCFENNPRL